MIHALYHIARNTYRECLRQPIFAILMFTSVHIIGSYPAFTGFVFREQEKLVTDGSLATILLFGWIVAVLCASHAIAREIDTGTALLILSKPVERHVFILAKISGILTALLVFWYANMVCALMALRIAKDQFRFDQKIMAMLFGASILACIIGGIANYIKKMSFPSIFVHSFLILITLAGIATYFIPAGEYEMDWSKPGGFSWNLARASLLILFAIWAIGTLATALSTRLNLVSNFTVCALVFVLGLISGYFTDQLRGMAYERVVQMMHSTSLLLPPIMLAFWILTLKNFHSRKQSRIGRMEIHGAFFVLLLLSTVRATYDVLNKVHLQEPSALMTGQAKLLYEFKGQLATLLSAILPNWQLFWVADGLALKHTIPLSYLGYGAVYGLLFIVMCVTLAIILFADREVGEQNRT